MHSLVGYTRRQHDQLDAHFSQKRTRALIFEQIDDNSFEVVAVSYFLPKPEAAFPLAPITRRSKNIQTFFKHEKTRKVQNIAQN